MVILLTWTPIVKWYMARFVFKNGQQKDTSYNEIGLTAQTTDFILGSVINTTGRASMITLTSHNFCNSNLIFET